MVSVILAWTSVRERDTGDRFLLREALGVTEWDDLTALARVVRLTHAVVHCRARTAAAVDHVIEHRVLPLLGLDNGFGAARKELFLVVLAGARARRRRLQQLIVVLYLR